VKDIIETVDEFIPEDNPKKWVKLNSTIAYRRLHLALLKDIAVSLRQLSKQQPIKLDVKYGEK
jgi:hypothetical protein